MNVLRFSGGPRYYLRQYAVLGDELGGRGHLVHVAFQRAKGGLPEGTEAALERSGVTHGFAPERPPGDGWRSVAWLVRALGDLARYADPRYAGALDLRDRMAARVVNHVRKPGDLEPLSRRLALGIAKRLVAG